MFKSQHEMLKEVMDTIWYDTGILWSEAYGIFYENVHYGNKIEIDLSIIIYDDRFWRYLIKHLEDNEQLKKLPDTFYLYPSHVWSMMETKLSNPVKYLYNWLWLLPKAE